MKKLNLGLAVLMLGAVSTAFAEPTGTINFTGTLVDGTCEATVNGGAADGSLTLPTMNIASLANADEVAGDTPFTIRLTGAGCTAMLGGVSKIATPYFEAESTKVNTEGRLINKASTDKADKVDIQLVNSNKTVIDLNEPANTQITTTGVVDPKDTNIADYKYFARYYATDTAVKGNIEASVRYSIFYK